MMTNHPNRSKSSPVRFIAYSTASMNALSEGTTIAQALERAEMHTHGDNDFIVVAQLRSKDALHHFDILPRKAVIVWRGVNELAQRFRAA
jgi:hypothetical protein